MTMLRVKNGPCAPLRFSSMLSRPATGITCISVTTGGEAFVLIGCSWIFGCSLRGDGASAGGHQQRLAQRHPLDLADDEEIAGDCNRRIGTDEDQCTCERTGSLHDVADHDRR